MYIYTRIHACIHTYIHTALVWSVYFNPILTLKYTDHTRAVAFADDLIIMTKAKNFNMGNKQQNKI